MGGKTLNFFYIHNQDLSWLWHWLGKHEQFLLKIVKVATYGSQLFVSQLLSNGPLGPVDRENCCDLPRDKLCNQY